MQTAVEKGGLIDGISTLLDTTLNAVSKAGILNQNVVNSIREGKNIILNNVQNNIEKEFVNQLNCVEKLNNYVNEWKINFKNKDFVKMEKNYKQIEKQLKNIAPVEKTINDARIVENIHKLIKNNGQNFNLSKEQIELAEKLM